MAYSEPGAVSGGPVGTAASRYNRWHQVREQFLRRARNASLLTIPSLVPPLGHGPSSELPTPYQGVGAAGVTNLASKLLMSLFSVPQPWFRLVPSDPEAIRSSGPKVSTEVEEGLAAMERAIASEFEVLALRVKLFEALKHLLVAGNVTFHVQPDGAARVVPLDQYVARRDPLGKLLCLVIREPLDPEYVPASVPQPPVPAMDLGDVGTPFHRSDARPSVSIYTCVEWDEESSRYHVRQEMHDGALVPGSVGSYREELLPWRVLRYAAIDGEDYGRGMVEEVIGDLVSLEGLTRAIVEAAAIMSRLVGLVDPAGAATADDLNNAPNGAYVVGRPTDVTYPPINKGGDLQVVLAASNRIEDRLQRAFLLHATVQRQAERVTAEEIRYVAQELEGTLGGVFSVLSQELQLPLVRMFMERMVRQGKIKRLPSRAVRPAIVTGIEALGRGQELTRLTVAAQTAQAVVGPEQFVQNINVRTFLGAIFAAAGVDTNGLLRTEEEIQQAAQQAQAMALAQRVGPQVVNAIGPGVAQRLGLNPEAPAPA